MSLVCLSASVPLAISNKMFKCWNYIARLWNLTEVLGVTISGRSEDSDNVRQRPMSKAPSEHIYIHIYIYAAEINTTRVEFDFVRLFNPFYWHTNLGQNLHRTVPSTPAILSLITLNTGNHMPCNVLGDITCPIQNFKDCSVDVWEWIMNFMPHL